MIIAHPNHENKSSQKKAIQIITDFLKNDNWPIAVHPENTNIIATKYKASAGIWICEAIIDNHDRFIFYSVAPDLTPKEYLPEVSEYLMRINDKLAVGNFEVNYDTGQVCMKTSIDFEGIELSHAIIKNIIYANVKTMNTYATGFVEVAAGRLKATDAIAQYEPLQ
jgi:hypothetical protein